MLMINDYLSLLRSQKISVNQFIFPQFMPEHANDWWLELAAEEPTDCVKH